MGEDEEDPCFSSLNFPFLPSPEYTSGTATPPLHTVASIPFKWEELPGKPRPCTDIVVRPESAKCLELPPCRTLKIPSPTAVLDGPYNLGRPKFHSFRLFGGEAPRGSSSFDSSSSGGSPVEAKRGFFGLRSRRKEKEMDGGSFGFSPLSNTGCERLKMAEKLTRSGSSSRVYRPPSTPLWVSMREGLKKAMPWKSSRKSKKERADF